MLPWNGDGVTRETWLAGLCSERIPNPAKRHVVEFGSATGEVTAALLAFGFQVTAIEGRESEHQAAKPIAPTATQIVGDVEALRSVDVGGPFDLIVHVGVLYHLLGPIEHLMQLREWGPRLLLDTHYCRGETPELHYERFERPRAGLRSSSWWLPLHMIQHWLERSWKTVEKVNDREERNGRRVTFWAES